MSACKICKYIDTENEKICKENICIENSEDDKVPNRLTKKFIENNIPTCMIKFKNKEEKENYLEMNHNFQLYNFDIINFGDFPEGLLNDENVKITDKFGTRKEAHRFFITQMGDLGPVTDDLAYSLYKTFGIKITIENFEMNINGKHIEINNQEYVGFKPILFTIPKYLNEPVENVEDIDIDSYDTDPENINNIEKKNFDGNKCLMCNYVSSEIRGTPITCNRDLCFEYFDDYFENQFLRRFSSKYLRELINENGMKIYDDSLSNELIEVVNNYDNFQFYNKNLIFTDNSFLEGFLKSENIKITDKLGNSIDVLSRNKNDVDKLSNMYSIFGLSNDDFFETDALTSTIKRIIKNYGIEFKMVYAYYDNSRDSYYEQIIDFVGFKPLVF